MAVDLSIVVVTYNSAPMIAGLIESIPRALAGLTADIVVVDNGSSDATVEVARTLPSVRVIEATNEGYSAGINRGIRESADSTAILILNPDVRLDPGSARQLYERLEHSGVGIVAPQVRDDNGHRQLSLRREPTLGRALGLARTRSPRLSEYVQEQEAYDAAHQVDWALGAILLVSRACSDAVGEWDESFFLYSEETDFCLRARDLGFTTWYEPAATAVHVGGQSGQSDAIHAMQIINRVRLYHRRHSWASSAAYFGLTVLSELTWVARGHPQSRFAVKALLRPSLRPAQLSCGNRLIPLE